MTQEASSSRRSSYWTQVYCLLSLALMTSGCLRVYRSIHPLNRSIHDLPSREELLGRWSIDNTSLERMKIKRPFYNLSKTQPSDHLLLLREDGTCLFKSYRFFRSDDDYTEAEGRWDLAKIDSPRGDEERVAGISIALAPWEKNETVVRFWLFRN